MAALPLASRADAVPDVLRRLAALQPGPHRVVSCYLKLEPRDKTRGKYLIKMKNRVRGALAELEGQGLARAVRDSVAADLERIRRYVDEPGRLPATRGIALFACAARGVWEVVPLPHVHRSRLGVEGMPLVRELVALEQEVGTILVAACDRTGARFFAVTAFGVEELPGLLANATRSSKFHGPRQAKGGGVLAGGLGERHHHMRIREEKQRHYARVADRIYELRAQRSLTGVVVAGIGVDAAAVVPHLHSYVRPLLLGVVKLNPKGASAAEVQEAALVVREERERVAERGHAAALTDGLGAGWAVNGIEPTLEALARGQVRALVVNGRDDDPRLDEAVEEALRQGAQVHVVYDAPAARAVAGLGALLRFRR